MVTDELAGKIRRQVVKHGAQEEPRCDECRAMRAVARDRNIDDRSAVDMMAQMKWGHKCPTCAFIAGAHAVVFAEWAERG